MSEEAKQGRKKVILRTEFPEKVQLVSMPDDIDIEIVPTPTSEKIYGAKALKLSMPEQAEAEKLALETIGKLNRLRHQIPLVGDEVDLAHFKEMYDMANHVEEHVTRVFDVGMLRTDLYQELMQLTKLVVDAVANRMFTHPVWKYNVANQLVTFHSNDNHAVDGKVEGTDLGKAVVADIESGQGFWFVNNEFVYLVEAFLTDTCTDNPTLRLAMSGVEDVQSGPVFVWHEIPETLIACLKNKEIPWRTPAATNTSN